MALPLTDLLIRKSAVQLNIPESIVAKVINYKWKSLNKAQHENKSLEDSGLGKFILRPKKVENEIKKHLNLVRLIHRRIELKKIDEKYIPFNLTKCRSLLGEVDYLINKLTDLEMKLKFKEIFEGWRNLIMPPEEIKSIIEEVASERELICKGCPFFSVNAKLNDYKTFRTDDHCTKCGCPIKAKARSLSSQCPMGYWTNVISEEEAYELNKKINEQQNNQLQKEDSGDN